MLNCNVFKSTIIITITIILLFLNHKYPQKNFLLIPRVKNPKFSLLGPYNFTKYMVNDSYNQLLDLQDFKFKISPQTCERSSLLLLAIVSSNPRSTYERSVIRSTWGKCIDSIKIVFLFGDSEDGYVRKIIKEESLKYGDIVQGNFVDSYRNLTYKHVMGLKWVAHHCQLARYVLKTDDDVAVNPFKLRRFLERELSPWGAEGLLACDVAERAKVERKEGDKWRVTYDEFPAEYFPPYCPGWVILYSQDVVRKLLIAVQSLPYFWIDDVQVTGVAAARAGVSHTPLTTLLAVLAGDGEFEQHRAKQRMFRLSNDDADMHWFGDLARDDLNV